MSRQGTNNQTGESSSGDQNNASATGTPGADMGGASATGTPGTDGTSTQGTGTAAQGQTRSIVLASEVLDANVMAGSMVGSTGSTGSQGGANATGTPGTDQGGASATGTPGTADTGAGQGSSQSWGTVADFLLDGNSGQICYVAIDLDQEAVGSTGQTTSGQDNSASQSSGQGSGTKATSAACALKGSGTGGTGSSGSQGGADTTGTPDTGSAASTAQGEADATGTPGTGSAAGTETPEMGAGGAAMASGWTLVPARAFSWDVANNALVLNVSMDVLSSIPTVNPDTFWTDGWADVDAFWGTQNLP
jgi:hypothetical protein